MESRPGSRLRRSPSPSLDGALSRRLPGSCDRISALSDDMILLVLSRLGSVRAAARTTFLSRRWRGLWTRLADLPFRSDRPATIKGALARIPESAIVSSIDIRCPRACNPKEANSLLQATTMLSPAELVFVLEEKSCPAYVGFFFVHEIMLPCFRRATSIELDVGLLSIIPPSSGEFPALEKLSLAGNIFNLGTLLDRCPRLRVLGVNFRGSNYLVSLDEALAALKLGVAGGLVLSFLGFNTRLTYTFRDAAQFSQLLHAMSMLSPQMLVFSDDFKHRIVEADFPCFQRATSIEMNLPDVCFTPLPDGEFSALERLSLSRGCSILDLGTVISRCPRLRILQVIVEADDIRVHSASLEELDVYNKTECQRIDIIAPVLKQLQLSVRAGSGSELSVSISAPMVEKVSWKRGYTTSALMFGFWWLEWAWLQSDQKEDTRSRLPHMNTLHLDISCIASGRTGSRQNFTKEMEKLLIANFSVLDLTLHTCEHVFGPLVYRILRMHRISAATEKLKIFLQQDHMYFRNKGQECTKDCPCHKPKNWRSQSIILPLLEEVEISYKGEDHEQDFLRFISKCSPMLKRVNLKLGYGREGCTSEVYNIFLAFPSVKVYVYVFSLSASGWIQQASGEHAT